MIHISRAVLGHKLPKDGTRYLLGRAGIRPRVWWYYTQHFTLAQTESEMGFGLGRRKDEKEAPNGGAGRPKETPGRPVYLVEGVPEAWSAGLCPLSVREVRPFPLFSSPMSASQSVRIGVCRIRYTDPGLRVWVQAAGTVCDRKGEGGFVGQGFRGWMVFCVWDGLLVTLSGMTL